MRRPGRDRGTAGTPPARDDVSFVLGLDFDRLPRHVAIIMDGNGRWARRRGLPRVAGHRAGIAAVRETLDVSARLGLEALTLYAFSRENWKRPSAEVNTLMRLLREYLESELGTLAERNVRFRAIGRLGDLPPGVTRALAEAEERTARNTGLVFQIALSYSGRAEIVDATRRIAQRVAGGELEPDAIDESLFAAHLYAGDVPDPDLLIRTSGELRVSNFLLWQIAYAEIWVTPVLWPDFRRQHLFEALEDFARRERRFGGVESGSGGASRVTSTPPAAEP
ncbi:MAG: isoprenyl transferase [Acidobacteriota bacterium]|nr:MAG: isoprenyl transferase [Acidobacteriota bacterium]